MGMLRELEQAKTELEIARSKFNNAIEQEDTDIAIAELNVAEKKMDRLLKSLK